MALEHLEGTTYGPYAVRVTPEQSAAFVAATRDDPARWTVAAPPSYAGALLFVAAPEFLHSPEVRERSQVLVHADQHFTWHAPLDHGLPLDVTGTVARVRARGEVDFVTFEAEMTSRGSPVVESRSMFVIGSEGTSDPLAEAPEPPVEATAANDTIGDGAAHGEMARSASRLDLVRYAAASGDFNPIHFDHATGVEAGFPGVIVHGLLMAAWLAGMAAARGAGMAPLADARFRFRNALYPAEQATASLALDGAAATLRLRRGEEDLVTASASLREE